MASLLKLSNNALGRLNAAILTTTTTLPLVPGQGSRFPSLSAGQFFPCTLIDATGAIEIVKVTARAGDNLTVLRAQENTTALEFAINDRCEHRLTAGALQSELDRMDAALTGKADASALAGKANVSDLAAKQNALGFTPYNASNPSGFISSVSSPQIMAAIGYTPANAGGQAFSGAISAPVITQTSDERQKQNWSPLTDAQLDALANMKLAGTFAWIGSDEASIGGSAQEIRNIVPQAVHEDADGALTVNYGGLNFAIAQATLRRLWGNK